MLQCGLHGRGVLQAPSQAGQDGPAAGERGVSPAGLPGGAQAGGPGEGPPGRLQLPLVWPGVDLVSQPALLRPGRQLLRPGRRHSTCSQAAVTAPWPGSPPEVTTQRKCHSAVIYFPIKI